MFQLASPWALWLLPLPLLVWYLLPRVKTEGLAQALEVPFFASLMDSIGRSKALASYSGTWLFTGLVWLALVIALAGPRFVGEPLPAVRAGYNIMLALDLSASMEIPDMMLHGRPSSRLAVVKEAAEAFVKARQTDKIGLILFGSLAYLQTPLTYDKHNVLMRIEDATPGLAGRSTSLGDALGLAVKRLNEVPKEGRIIILLTDGANNSGVLSPLKAAALAYDEGIKVYTIGLGAKADPRALAADLFNGMASADLDEGTLQQIASITKGQYFRATDTDTLHRIYKTIHQLESVKQDKALLRPQHDYYVWFTAAAMLLCLIYCNLGRIREGLSHVA